MNDAAAVCPHCGKRRAGAASNLGDAKLSGAEIAALLTLDAPASEPPQNLFQSLLLPHPQTFGLARTSEIVLTIACLPMILVGAMTLAFGRRREMHGEVTPVVVMSGVGGVGLGSLLALVADIPTTLVIVGAEIAGLIIRGVIRSRAVDSRSRSLTRIDR
jgi:hypothetical protein